MFTKELVGLTFRSYVHAIVLFRWLDEFLWFLLSNKARSLVASCYLLVEETKVSGENYQLTSITGSLKSRSCCKNKVKNPVASLWSSGLTHCLFPQLCKGSLVRLLYVIMSDCYQRGITVAW